MVTKTRVRDGLAQGRILDSAAGETPSHDPDVLPLGYRATKWVKR